MKIFFLVVIMLIFHNLAIADDNRSNLYLGTGGSFDFLKNDTYSETGIIGGSVNIGYNFNEYMAIEFRKGTSLSSSSTLLLDDAMVLYGKGKYPISKDFGIYALTGFGKTSVSENLAKVSSDSGMAFGLGLAYRLSTAISLYTDYSIVSSSVSQVNFGFNYYFDNKGLDNLPPDAPKVQSFKEKKADEKLMEELRIKEKFEAKKKKEAEEKLKLPTIVKIKLLHKEDTKKPILVYFFELKSKEQFKRMDYEELINNEKEMLDGEIVSREKEILKPGKMMEFTFNVKFDSNYYAVVAALNDVQSDDSWRHIIKVNAHEINSINLMLDHKKIMEFSK